MNNFPGVDSALPTSVNRKRWLITGVAALVVLILLLIFAPALIVVLSIPAFIIALIALIVGGLRWARIRNRRVAGGLLGGTFVLFIVSAVVFSSTLPAATTGQVASAETPTAAPSITVSEEPTLTDFVGEACDADHLVMSQGEDNLHCDDDGDGGLVWFTAADHDVAVEKAAKLAAEEEAAAKKAAEEAAAKEAAEQEAAEKEAAEKKAAQEAAQEAERKAAAEAAEQEAAEEAAAERAAAAEAEAAREAEQQAPRQVQSPSQNTAPTSAFYKNCDAVRAAGAAPIRAGQPGYSRKLDRDGDGIGCE
ncbi:excalibur calcium-binding domain-containing protein [Citricoccus sp.]|uniref:excalibur calcium-binding domain-containing protein n=1 Tax=Citricoccus sp. TaxID=1978372 RepID=UPI0028BF3DA6|nr:excalibur calcium-binding domain-containing protein [Citricoccus sp.]